MAASYKVIDMLCTTPKDLVFWSCPNCMCKMLDQFISLGLYCKSCEEYHQHTPTQRKFKLPLRAAETNTRRVCHLTLFGKSLERVFGCDAENFTKLAAKVPANYEWSTVLQEILVGKIVSVNVSDTKLDLYPNVTAHGLQLSDNLLPASVIDLVKIDISHIFDNQSLTFTSGNKVTTYDNEHAIEERIVHPAKPIGFSSKKSASSIGSTWHESLLQEFEETFLCEWTDDSTLALGGSNAPSPHANMKGEKPAHGDGQTLVRKRLLSQLDTSLSSSPVGLPQSKPRIFSPCHHPVTSTPRQSSKRNSLNHPFKTIKPIIISTDDMPIESSEIKEDDSHIGNMSLDLFSSEIAESLTLLSFTETSKT